MKVALYARYSSDSQRDASITDQLRICRAHAEQNGWRIVEEYTDHAVSGASLLRPGIQALISDAGKGRFDLVLAEAMDRLSRDQEDIAGLFKRMAFGNVKIMTLSEGEVGQLHIGLKGTMNAMFLKDLADKTRRGLRGRIEDGKSGGGLCFGYDVVRRLGANGDAIRGDRTINDPEAAVIRRIFRDYVEGKSSRTIAWELNKEGVPGPQGAAWGPSTIHGNPKRGVGILNNELYVGRLVWNRLRYLKDPDTGKRVSRLNPESDWMIRDVPEMRVVDQELWDRAKARQSRLALDPQAAGANPLNDRRRPKHLFTGLAKCGSWGGGISMISKDLLGCSAARNKGICGNRLNIRRDALEASVMSGLRTHLMEPELFKAFCEEFTREMNRLRIERDASIIHRKQELEAHRARPRQSDPGDPGRCPRRASEGQDREASRTGNWSSSHWWRRAASLLRFFTRIWRRSIIDASRSFARGCSKKAASPRRLEVLRTLVDEITLVPEEGHLSIVLRGDLAAILAFAANKKKPGPLSEAGLSGDFLSPVSLVAGTGFEPVTFRL